jgi:Na+/phosphate symporter
MREHAGPSLGIGALASVWFTILGVVIVPILWLSLTVYAVVKAIGSAPEAPSATTIALIVVAIVTVLVAIFAGLVALIGRSMKREKRGDRRADRPALAVEP